jgi:hypothetical protein
MLTFPQKRGGGNEWTPGEVNERVPGRAIIFGARKHKPKTRQ